MKWKDFEAKPSYPILDATYSIPRAQEPREDSEQSNRYLVDGIDMQKTLKTLRVWESTLRELASIMVKNEQELVKVVFYRDDQNNRTHVKTVKEALECALKEAAKKA
jgi:hypothetical protein